MVGDVYKALGKVCGIDKKPETVLALVDVFNGRVHEKFYKLDQPMTDLRNNVTLVAYRYPSAELGPESGFKELHIFQRYISLHCCADDQCQVCFWMNCLRT